ncbi:MAG: aldose 1-epimerase family protein [Bacteroidales bacterium]|nr:aldose 1-epimerase family protein [Bacteroidales bacterium]
MILSNDTITIEVAEQGAELVSLKKDGREYMWTGDANYWNRHAPILFPVVGKPFNNELHIDGRSYPMKQHGFARDSRFEEMGVGCMRMVDADRREVYPFLLALEARYRLQGSAVEVTWAVENKDSRELYFQIGAHPGFLLPDYKPDESPHGFIRFFDKYDAEVAPVVTSCLVDGNRVPRAADVQLLQEMPLMSDTFAHDALIIEQAQVAAAELCDRHGRPVLRVSCPQAEAFGIWAPDKEGCPFVCLEPWCGICDTYGFAGDIAERTYIHRLAPQGRYEFTYFIKLY